jgi:hypothetical protein
MGKFASEEILGSAVALIMIREELVSKYIFESKQ